MFSTVIPGAVSGDVVKAYYVVRGRERKTEAVATILLDRLVGLYTMVTLAVFVVAAAWIATGIGEEMEGGRSLSAVSISLWILFLAMTFATVISSSATLRDSRFVSLILEKAPFKETLGKLYDAVYVYRRHPKPTLLAFLYSFLSQAPFFLGIYCMAKTVNTTGISAWGYLLIFPVGLILNALPILPGGLGQGEVAFEWLFSLFGSDQGAEVALLYHVGIILVAFLIGGSFYLFGSKDYDMSIGDDKKSR
jgi:uncharacterized protein (TIRG00374 family)